MRQKRNHIDVSLVETDPNWVLVFIFITVAAILFTGYWFYQEETDQIISQKESILTSIASLKAQQITEWYLDELFDAEVITRNPALLETAHRFNQNRTTADSSRLAVMLNQIKIEHDYKDILLTSMDGNILVGTSPDINMIASIELLHIEKAVQEGSSVSTDLFRSVHEGEEQILISFVSIIQDEDGFPTQALVFRFDSDQFLYPLIEYWPLPSRSAESFIFKAEGDSILYLNNLRHLTDAALNFRLPVSQPGLPAAAGASGYAGVFRGIDYHNENVVSYVTNIEGTPWFLVSKIEESEIFEEVSGIFWSVMGLVILGILFSAAAIGFIYNQRQKSIYRELYGKEKELWQQMEKFKVTMDSLGEGVIITDLGAKVQYMNFRAEKLTGWRSREARGRLLGEIYQVINENTGLHENNILEKVIKHGIVKELANHTILIHKSGEEIPVMDTGAPIYDAEGQLNGIVITFQDETEKRTQQKKLKENEAQFKYLFEFSADAVFIADVETGIILNANKAAEKLLNMPRKKIIGLHQLSLLPKEREEYSKMLFQNAVRDLQKQSLTDSVEFLVVREDGEWVPVEMLASMVVYKGKKCLMGSFRNISERKKFESELKKLSKAIEQSPSSIIITNIDGEIEYVNPAFVLITGYSKESVIGENPRILNSGVHSKEFYQDLWKTITSGDIWRGEICNKKKNGELYWDQASISPVKNSDGTITHYIAVKEDITERRVAEERIRENEKYLESLFKSVPDTIVVLNKRGEILHFNPSSMGFTSAEINKKLGNQLTDLLPKEIKKLQNGKTANRQQDRQVVKFQLEMKNEEIKYHFSARMVPFGEDKVIVTLSDITETIQNFNRINSLLRIEEMQRKKLQSFTHIVSHNLRSHTADMEGLFDVLAMDESSILENPYIQLIKDSSVNLRNTIGHLNQILEIHDEERKDWNRVDLHKTVNRTMSIISNLSETGDVTIYNQVPGETWVTVIPGYIDSIVLNLMTNAIKFRSENRDSYLKITTRFEMGYRVLSFEDNGLGIDLKRHREKLFRLYKTFHAHNDSRGLGLFMVKSQVEAMGGKIEVESDVEKGSTFKIYLPDEKD